ncbi:MAG: hypothetical protein HY329_00160 [Chloroflexi bacterium]|nr:hypothetical protein [Chloroflexota bacterium]
MSTLTTLRAALRQDLHDEDGSAYRWTDAVLNRHLQRALEELQNAWPLDAEASIPAVAGQLHYALGSLTGLLWVERVWYPYDVALPAVWAPFREAGGSLYLQTDDPPAGTETIRVFYAKAHTVDASGSTVLAEHEHVLVAGVAAHALADLAVKATGQVNLSRFTARDLSAIYDRRRAEFDAQLQRLRNQRLARASHPVTWTFADSTGRLVI